MHIFFLLFLLQIFTLICFLLPCIIQNISYREIVTVTRGLKDKDLTAAIILNLTQKRVQKCRFEGKNDWETLAKYYAKAYPNYLTLIDPPSEKEEKNEDESKDES